MQKKSTTSKFPGKLKIKMVKKLSIQNGLKKVACSLYIDQSESGLFSVTKINLNFAMKFLFQGYWGFVYFFNRYILKSSQ